MALKKRYMTEKQWAKHCEAKNRDHVKRAKATLIAFMQLDPGYQKRDRIDQTTLVDLLGDLRHYAKAKDLSYDDADRSAFNHFEAETHGEE